MFAVEYSRYLIIDRQNSLRHINCKKYQPPYQLIFFIIKIGAQLILITQCVSLLSYVKPSPRYRLAELNQEEKQKQENKLQPGPITKCKQH